MTAAFDYGDLVAGLPPAPVLWTTALIDTLCLPLQCAPWRESLGLSEDSGWHHKVPPIVQHTPNLLTFQDFVSQQATVAPNEQRSMWSLLYEYAFETPSTALGDLTTPTSLLVLVGLVLILRRIKFILLPFFSNLGRQAGRKTHGPNWEVQNQVRIAKFGEYVFRLFYHSIISLYGVYYFYDKEWWAGNTLSLFQGFPHHPIEPGMAWYYLLQAAYNLDALVSLLELSFVIRVQSPVKNSKQQQYQWPITIQWSPTVRGDFREMAIHHVITNLLVMGSSLCRLTRIGSMVFLLHDISDVPVDLSKLANFLKWKYTTLTCFATMVLLWMMTRLYVLPFYIYKAVLTESHYVCHEGTVPAILYMTYRHLFYILVGLLIFLHLLWFVMFLQIFATFLSKNECHDLSEHKQGEQHHEPVVAVVRTTTTKEARYENGHYADEKKDE